MRTLKLAVVAVLVGAALVVVTPGTEANAKDRHQVMSSAAGYARNKGYTVGIAVLDTRTGHFYGSGNYRGIFASESLIKVFIATRLILQGRMHGTTKSRAYKMITQSDDAIATSFYGSVGGDGLVGWIKRHYHVPNLGYGPSRAGWWGNNHLRPAGLVRLYAKLKTDKRVAPWLLNAMHHATRHGSDGTYQFFGLPSAARHPAIKQGWGNDLEGTNTADFNTTGFVDHKRYAVAILARGPSSSYGSRIGSLLTNVARRVLPGGTFPDPTPTIKTLSSTSGPTAGGHTLLIRGTNLTHVTLVRFGSHEATHLRRLSPGRLRVTIPAHGAGTYPVRVVTTHGRTAHTRQDLYTYE